MNAHAPKAREKSRRRPVSPGLVALAVMTAGGCAVALIAAPFEFVPVDRQIAWLGASFTLTATCVAYVVQNARRTEWDEQAYEAARRRAAVRGRP